MERFEGIAGTVLIVGDIAQDNPQEGREGRMFTSIVGLHEVEVVLPQEEVNRLAAHLQSLVR